MLPVFLLASSILSCLFSRKVAAQLLYPENTLFQITLGVSVPAAMSKKGSLVVSSGFQMNFALPSNLSQLEPTLITARQARDLDLRDVYVAIEDLLNRHGWRDGRHCLLRSICELAELPIDRTERDLLREVVHLVLTPSEDLPEAVRSSHRSVDEMYREAERLGESVGGCELAYPRCLLSPLQSFTDVPFL